MKKTILLLALAMILLSSLAYAADVTDAHGLVDTGGDAQTTRQGFWICVNNTLTNNITLKTITKWSAVTGTHAYVHDDGNNVIANETFSGGNATMNVNLTIGSCYIISVASDSASYGRRYDCSDVSYPYQGTNIWWAVGHDGALNQSSCGYNIESVTSEEITPPPVEISSKIDLLFSNTTAITTYKTLFNEGEDFHVFVNWTNSTGTALNESNGNCTISIIDGIVEIAGEFDNFTLCDSGCNFSTRSREFDFETATNAVNDSLHFFGCHEQTASGNIEINLSCSAGNEILTVEAAEMPLCASGTAFIRKTTSVCITDTILNISTDTAGNIPFSQRKRILDAAADREYSVDVNTYPSFTFYNSTTGFWQTNHSHEYYEHGIATINASCTHTNINFTNATEENITIVNIPPQIFLEQITTSLGTTTLSEGVSIEFANGTWQWLISVVDDDIQFINYTWFNSTGTQIFSTTATGTPEIINTSSSLFVDFSGNPFNLTVFANDTNGNSTTASITFNATDTVNPSCNFADNYLAFINRSFSFDVTCTDENFFELNVTCPANSFTNVTTGLNVPSFNFIDSIDNVVADTCSFRYCDGHTAASLESDWIVYPDNDRKELFKDGKSIGLLWVDDGEIELEKIIDRYKFKVKFDESKPYQSIYFNSTGNPVYLEDDKYMGWLVDSQNKVWIDMNNNFNIPMTLIKRKGGLWEYRLVTDEEEVEFESIGELNCVEGSFGLEDQFSNYGIFAPTTCWIDDNLQNSFIFAFVVFFLAMLFVLNECIIKLPMFNLLIGTSFIFMGASMWACSQLMSIPFVIFGIAILWYEISLMTGYQGSLRP